MAEPSSPYIPFNRKNNPSAYPPLKNGTKKKETYEQLKIPGLKVKKGKKNREQLLAGMFGYSDEYLHRSKALQDIINDPGTDPSTLIKAQTQYIQMQKAGDIWKKI